MVLRPGGSSSSQSERAPNSEDDQNARTRTAFERLFARDRNKEPKQRLTFTEFTGRAVVSGVVSVVLILVAGNEFSARTDGLANRMDKIIDLGADLQEQTTEVVETFCAGIEETGAKMDGVSSTGRRFIREINALREQLGITTTSTSSTTVVPAAVAAPTTTTTTLAPNQYCN